MRRPPAWWLFWGSAAPLVYAHAGYPLLAAARGLLRPRPASSGTETPMVSVIIAAHNEAALIIRKLDNTFALDYPTDKIEVIVASDGSDDATDALVRDYGDPRVRLLALPRRGKNQALNAAAAVAYGDILVFSDADTLLQPDALRRLVAPFADPSVGGVGGEHRYGSGPTADLKRWLKELQSQADGLTAAEGQLYAIRRSLYRAIPPDVTDDFYASVQVWAAHRRLVFAPGAVAREVARPAPGAELPRKARIVTGSLNGLWRMRALLNPRVYGFYAVQLFSHKVLRRFSVFFWLGLGLSAPRLARRGRLYRAAALAQAGVWGVALAGVALRETPVGRLPPLRRARSFAIDQAATIIALWRIARGRRGDLWTPTRTPAEAAERDARVA
jgi:glycosyltransferase involved in cell wall biosynthesis